MLGLLTLFSKGNLFHPRLDYLFKHSEPINFLLNTFREMLVLAACKIKKPWVTSHKKTQDPCCELVINT